MGLGTRPDLGPGLAFAAILGRRPRSGAQNVKIIWTCPFNYAYFLFVFFFKYAGKQINHQHPEFLNTGQLAPIAGGPELVCWDAAPSGLAPACSSLQRPIAAHCDCQNLHPSCFNCLWAVCMVGSRMGTLPDRNLGSICASAVVLFSTVSACGGLPGTEKTNSDGGPQVRRKKNQISHLHQLGWPANAFSPTTGSCLTFLLNLLQSDLLTASGMVLKKCSLDSDSEFPPSATRFQ